MCSRHSKTCATLFCVDEVCQEDSRNICDYCVQSNSRKNCRRIVDATRLESKILQTKEEWVVRLSEQTSRAFQQLEAQIKQKITEVENAVIEQISINTEKMFSKMSPSDIFFLQSKTAIKALLELWSRNQRDFEKHLEDNIMHNLYPVINILKSQIDDFCSKKIDFLELTEQNQKKRKADHEKANMSKIGHRVSAVVNFQKQITVEEMQLYNFNLVSKKQHSYALLRDSEQRIVLFDVERGREKMHLQLSEPIRSVLLLSPKHLAASCVDKTVRVYSVKTRRCIRFTQFSATSGMLRGGSLRNRLNEMAIANNDKTAYLWDWTRNATLKLRAHSWVVECVEYLSKNLIATGGWDEKIRIYRVPNAFEDKKAKNITVTLEEAEIVIDCPGENIKNLLRINAQLLASFSEKRVVKVWNCVTRQCIFSQQRETMPFAPPLISIDEESFAVLCAQNSICIFRPTQNTFIMQRLPCKVAALRHLPLQHTFLLACEDGQFQVYP